jgi:hypothetical protein
MVLYVWEGFVGVLVVTYGREYQVEVQNSDLLGFITTLRCLCKRVNQELNLVTGVRLSKYAHGTFISLH